MAKLCRHVLIEMAAGGYLNDTTRPLLARLHTDADEVFPMAWPDPDDLS